MKGKYPKNHIKELRESRGLSLEKLAQAVGVTNPHISMLELGKRGLSWVMVQKLAAALDCHPLEITEGSSDKRETKTALEQDLLKAYRKLEGGEKKMFLHILSSYAARKKPSPVK